MIKDYIEGLIEAIEDQLIDEMFVLQAEWPDKDITFRLNELQKSLRRVKSLVKEHLEEITKGYEIDDEVDDEIREVADIIIGTSEIIPTMVDRLDKLLDEPARMRLKEIQSTYAALRNELLRILKNSVIT